MDLRKSIILKCNDSGFPLANVIDILPNLKQHSQSYKKYSNWIDKKYHGEMGYLERGLERKKDPRILFPEAKSILCVGLPYSSKIIGSNNSQQGVKYARYLRGEDYHKRIPSMLKQALESLEDATLKWKICVDTSALLERTWAALAGLGWIGKNSMLIHPKYGSYFLLGFALLNKEVHHTETPMKNYCGNCTKCINNCPTKAIIEQKSLDSKKCISYITLEKKNKTELLSSHYTHNTNWIAGCDICQEVCPFNLKKTKIEENLKQDFEPNYPYLWDELDSETENSYKNRIKNSALNRIKYNQFKENILLIKRLQVLPKSIHKDESESF